MGLDKETIEKRVSRIELDIDHMNQMIDENLKLNEAGQSDDNALMDKVSDNSKIEAINFDLNDEMAGQELAKRVVQTDLEELNGQVGKDDAAQSSFKEVIGNAAHSFVHGAGKKEEAQVDYDNGNDDLPRDSSTQESEIPEDASLSRKVSLERSEGGEVAYDARETPYIGQEVQLTRSEVSNDEYYDLSEERPGEAAGEATSETYSIQQDDEEEPFQGHDDPRNASLGQASSIRVHKHEIAPSQRSSEYEGSNDEWEDEEFESTPEPSFDNATESFSPQTPQQNLLQEQETPRRASTGHEIQSQEKLELPGQPRGGAESLDGHNQETLPQAELDAQADHETGNESADQPISELNPDSSFQEPSSIIENHPLGSGDPVDAGQRSNASGGEFREHLYDVYDEQSPEIQIQSQLGKEEPRDTSFVGPYHNLQEQEAHPYSYSYETFATVDAVPPHTADVSHDSENGFASDSSYSRSLPGTADTEDSIYIPKNSVKDQRPTTTSNTPVASRRPTNPFRVVSVGVVGPDGRTSRKTSSGTYTHYKDHHQMDGPAILQKKLDQLTKKCVKLQKEINYLSQMNSSSSLPMEDSRKLARAIAKLQEYLDKKNKEKYDVGVLLSRQLRKEIDRGENGQFWIGTK